MSQSTFITAMLLAGFVLFLAANNRLGTYAAVLWGATAAPPPQPAKSGGGGGIGGFLGKVTNSLKGAASIASFAAGAP